MSITRISDCIVPEIFATYTLKKTAELSELIKSGALVSNPQLVEFLNGAGRTCNLPTFTDLTNEKEYVSNDSGTDSTPSKIMTVNEVQVRLSRNKSWGSADLVASLIGTDPMNAIIDRVAYYWARRFQAAVIATVKGVFANNGLPDNIAQGHLKNDMVVDISGTIFNENKTTICPSAVIDTAGTMGDHLDDLSLLIMHSIVYTRLQKQNLIEFIPNARGEANIPTYLGRKVIVDDSMPNENGVFETWLLGKGCIHYAFGRPKVPVETQRNMLANEGGGEEILQTRVEWAIHPCGYAFVGQPNSYGGPTNESTANNLANANSWKRAWPERKQIRMAKLITREY